MVLQVFEVGFWVSENLWVEERFLPIVVVGSGVVFRRRAAAGHFFIENEGKDMSEVSEREIKGL